MKTAVVILNWNGRALLEKFLPSVVQHSEEARIYVADNASSDDSVEFLKEFFPQVEIIEIKENLGYAGGYNEALKKVSEELVILLNSDVEVTPNWLPPIISAFEKQAEVAAVQPKILDYKRKEFFEYAGAAGGFIDKFAYPFCRGRIFQHLEKDTGQYNDETFIFWASGACLAVRKSIFFEVGALDEDFFAHQEEIDLCWRLKNFGYKVKYVSASKIYHVGGGTLEMMNPRKTFYNFRNSLYLILKNVEGSEVYYILLGRMVLDGIAGIKFIIEGKFQHFIQILKAHGSFYQNFFRMKKKRRKGSNTGKYYEVPSVVYAHYIERKNEFRELKK
ncbi:dTDP-Rha--alpha-D-GlcNAc-pyrophosphate polyprenol alpha-3-L-rhamnosyltransferase [Christiangramia fulva]|uniref:dTDP-Rha--alpha-D-GlcNAc-pyrophosphate polyprenol alpha-3-L-rhamnosyltransferase n=1 Tax=Christiangramia fulva TaxID=2126553 RepID=A0A2R3Z6A5_9FLAO|nr:glycosyltransferase family 2 protein [Christiangramia fulva]AVR45795.1 dTDP-Rha--alpha-D-GlcNAc-pyrophosphate polyprenol alpha-3-L-rhamnosyltransferase [Christiangramia fulva]